MGLLRGKTVLGQKDLQRAADADACATTPTVPPPSGETPSLA